MNKRAISKWIKALRSGKYQQTHQKLQDSDGYCCLGVACEIFIPKNKQISDLDNNLLGGTPSRYQTNAPTWLMEIETDFFRKCQTPLFLLNDGGITKYGEIIEPLSFDEIADILQLVYIEGSL